MAIDATQPTLDELVSALHRSHDRLVAVVTPLPPRQIGSPSYDTEWSIAQVLSHLGSSAEIFSMFLDAGERDEAAPGIEAFQPVWDRWNAKSPANQVRDALVVDAAFLAQLDALRLGGHERWHVTMFGDERRLRDVVAMRVSEHAVHTWDVAVAIDDEATISPDAVELLIDTLPAAAARSGKPLDQSVRAQISTHDPNRIFELAIDADGATLSASERVGVDGEPVIVLSAEALIRLVYGRLDAGHTPADTSADVDLDLVRRAFPGF